MISFFKNQIQYQYSNKIKLLCNVLNCIFKTVSCQIILQNNKKMPNYVFKYVPTNFNYGTACGIEFLNIIAIKVQIMHYYSVKVFSTSQTKL